MTIGIDFSNLILHGKKMKLQMWDTAGQERYRSISSAYYKNSYIIIMVYDISNRVSYDSMCSKWYEEVKEHTDEDTVKYGILIVGNKSDLNGDREVTIEEAEDHAKSINAMHMEFSAKDSSSQQMIDKILEVIGKVLIVKIE